MSLIVYEETSSNTKTETVNNLDIINLDTSVYQYPNKSEEVIEFWTKRQYKEETVEKVLIRGFKELDPRLFEYVYERMSHLPKEEIDKLITTFISTKTISTTDKEETTEEGVVEVNTEVKPEEEWKEANKIEKDTEYIGEESKGVVDNMALLNNKEAVVIQSTAIQAVQDNIGAVDYTKKHSRYKDVEGIVEKMREHFNMFNTDIPKFMQINEKLQKSGVLEFTEKPDTEEETSNSIPTSSEIITMGENFVMKTAYLTIIGEDKKKDNQKLDKTIKMLKLIVV